MIWAVKNEIEIRIKNKGIIAARKEVKKVMLLLWYNNLMYLNWSEFGFLKFQPIVIKMLIWTE